jgi:hypothetical protein
MSLVSLSSRSEHIQNLVQNPNDFRNHFPQPLILKPHSQVCITNLTFTAVEGPLFVIQGNTDAGSTSGNNRLLFGFEDALATAGYDVAILEPGKYTGAELATEIARAMNIANRMKYYTFSCAFTAGNPAANPIELPVFTISYAERVGLNPTTLSVGDWVVQTRRPESDMIFGDTTYTVGGVAANAKKIALADVPTSSHSTAFSWQKGVLLYTQGEGGGSAVFTVSLSDGANVIPDSDSSAKIHTQRFGLIRPTLAGAHLRGSIGEVDRDMAFSRTRSDIRITTTRERNGNRVKIYVNKPKYDGTPIFEDSTSVKVREFLLGGITTPALRAVDKLAFKITNFYRTNDFIVQIFKSVDGGATYTALADGGGNAEDGRPKVYTTTMDGFADGTGGKPAQFTSVVYTTQGIDDGAGGVVAGTQIVQQFLPAQVAMIPWVDLPRKATFSGVEQDQNQYTGLDLLDGSEDAPCEFQLDLGGGVTADNQYTISFEASTTGNGYDGKINISVAPPVSDTAPVPTTDVLGVAFKQDARQVNVWNIYTDDATPIASAVSIGTMTYDLTTNLGGLTIDGGFGGGNWVGTVVGTNKPDPVSEPLSSECCLVENPDDQLIYIRRNVDEIGVLYPHERTFDTTPTLRELLGEIQPLGILNTIFRGITGRVTNNDVDRIGTGVFRRLKVGLAGTTQRLLGFSETSFQLARADRDVESDVSPDNVLDGANNLHVSVPDLSNVRSVEGESAQRYKTIGVIPKNTFQTDDTGTMSYLANYDNWIDVNNASELQLNELSFQIRKPNGKVSNYVSGVTRATIKFREDPEMARMRAFDRLAERIALTQTQTSQPIIDPNTFVGS